MVRLRSQFWVILICVGATSGLLSPQRVQALGWFGHSCGGGCGSWGGGCGGGLFSGAGYWGGGGCCGGRVRYKYRLKCKRRRCCSGYGVGYGGYDGFAGCGCGAAGLGGGYATGSYGTPVYDPGAGPTWSNPSTIESAPQPNLIPQPAAPNSAPVEVPPAPETPPAPIPQQGKNAGGPGFSAFAVQAQRVDGADGTGIVVYVPEDAVVFVNDRQMKTRGTERRFSADHLQSGKVYDYEIRAEMVRNGAKLVRTEHVSLKVGHLEEVAFDFTDTVAPIQTVQGLFPETKLTVVVPADACVFLAGEDTISVGKVRKFTTNELANGQAWKDYEVRVEVERNGKTIVKTKKLSLFAGDEKELEFQFEAEKKVASTR